MEEIVSNKGLVHMIGFLLSVVILMASLLVPKENSSTVSIVGFLLLLVYFLVMPESYLHELFFKSGE